MSLRFINYSQKLSLHASPGLNNINIELIQ